MKDKEKKKSKFKLIRNIIIALIALGIVAFIFMIAPDYINKDIVDRTNLIINNKNVTSSLKNKIIIQDNVCYLSENDIKNFFDKYLYYDEKENIIITTYEKKIASLELEKNVMNVNGNDVKIIGKATKIDGVRYLPFTEMNDVFNMESEYIQQTDRLVIDSLDREQIKADSSQNLSVKLKTKTLSRTVDNISKGEKVIVISSDDNGWSKIRTARGKMGYIKTNKLANLYTVREKMEETKQINGKVNLIWDYYSEYTNAPDRTGTTINGVNVVSPSFFFLEKLGKGEIIDNVGTAGEEYIKWAHSNGYKVWPIFSNNSMIETTSEIMKDYNLRQKTISKIIDLAVKYDLDGINLNFENMYEADKNLFSRFVIELYPRMRDAGLNLSVDVTAPDGGSTWSMCYNRNVIADNCDYIVFMAYDQYGVSSKSAGTTAGYNWVKVSLNKFLTTEEIESEKIILGIPFYTRVWTEDANGNFIKSSIVNMKDIQNYLSKAGIPNNPTWDETTRQNYIEYSNGKNIYKMWIEDEKSIKEKLSLINENKLGGVASWEKDRESEEVWDLIKETLGL